LDPPGLPDSLRPYVFELGAQLAGQAGNGCVIDVVRHRPSLLATEALDVGILPVEIDRIGRVDLDLLRRSRIERSEFRPDAHEIGDADFRPRQKIKRS